MMAKFPQTVFWEPKPSVSTSVPLPEKRRGNNWYSIVVNRMIELRIVTLLDGVGKFHALSTHGYWENTEMTFRDFTPVRYSDY
jgi:hypothetical protein